MCFVRGAASSRSPGRDIILMIQPWTTLQVSALHQRPTNALCTCVLVYQVCGVGAEPSCKWTFLPSLLCLCALGSAATVFYDWHAVQFRGSHYILWMRHRLSVLEKVAVKGLSET
ncbi:hypothetical protein TRVL_00123 [Trypanosoma vivax]|nr:hypothetical protein TRVL_00123 [Trypanosoma vivax]